MRIRQVLPVLIADMASNHILDTGDINRGLLQDSTLVLSAENPGNLEAWHARSGDASVFCNRTWVAS